MPSGFDDDFFSDETEEGSEETQEVAAPRRGMLFMILLIFLAVIVIIIVAVVLFSNRSQKDKFLKSAAGKLQIAEQLPEHGMDLLLFDMGDIYVNIMGMRSTRILKFRPFLELSEKKILDNLIESEGKTEDETTDLRLNFYSLARETIEKTARDMTYAELDEISGPSILKARLIKSLNYLFRDRMAGAVINVYFDEFNIQ